MSAASSPRLEAQLEQATREERRRALRTLLMKPLLAAADAPAAMISIRRHATWLRTWLARFPGWRLHVGSEIVRLRKSPSGTSDGTRPARDPKNRQPFNRRRYVLLCLALAALERSDRQTTLGKLADTVMTFAAADPALEAAGIRFDLEARESRRDLVQVVRLLLELHVLARVHGDEDRFVKERKDVLYNVGRPALAAMLDVQRGPSTVDAERFEERLEAITEEPRPDSVDARNRRLRSTLCRRLLDDPILYYDRLDEDEEAYLQSQRPHLVREIRAATGLEAEMRLEGLAMVDERGEVTDLGLPEEGTDGHLALLLAEYLADVARRATGGARNGPPIVSRAALESHTAKLIAEHKKRWRNDVQRPEAPRTLTRATLERLAALDLVRLVDGGVQPLPAIARFPLARRAPAAATLFDLGTRA